MSLECESIKSQILAANPSLSSVSDLKHHDWLKIQRSVYKLGMFVLLERDDMTPKFGKIKNIIHIQAIKKLVFCVEVYEGYCFSVHYNAFGVRNTANILVVDVHALKDHHSFTVRKSFDVSNNTLYITMPYMY